MQTSAPASFAPAEQTKATTGSSSDISKTTLLSIKAIKAFSASLSVICTAGAIVAYSSSFVILSYVLAASAFILLITFIIAITYKPSDKVLPGVAKFKATSKGLNSAGNSAPATCEDVASKDEPPSEKPSIPPDSALAGEAPTLPSLTHKRHASKAPAPLKKPLPKKPVLPHDDREIVGPVIKYEGVVQNPFIGAEAIIKSQAEMVGYLTTLSNYQDGYNQIRKAHFDWVVFPINNTSTHGHIYCLTKEAVDILKENKGFIDNLREATGIVLRAWMYKIPSSGEVLKGVESSYCINHPRVRKMLHSLVLFEQYDLAKHVRQFIFNEGWPREVINPSNKSDKKLKASALITDRVMYYYVKQKLVNGKLVRTVDSSLLWG